MGISNAPIPITSMAHSALTGVSTAQHHAAVTTLAHSALSAVATGDHHAEAHAAASHSDQSATGAELNELTDASVTALHSHTPEVKVWCFSNASAPPVIQDSFNVTSAARSGVGAFTLTVATNFANAVYAAVGTAQAAAPYEAFVSVTAKAVGVITLNCTEHDGDAADAEWNILVCGDQ